MRKMNFLNKMLSIAILSISLVSCQDDNEQPIVLSEGTLTHAYIMTLNGFAEELGSILTNNKVDQTTFIALSTDSVWSLPMKEQQALRSIRDAVSRPDGSTLLQKIIPLEDLSTYMNNIYGGTVGGFIAEAADVKSLATMKDIYYGLRMDYDGTKFRPDGAGYAVIRFYSTMADKLSIPYSPELGGTQPHSWPNGGGGFTTSTLGKGGYPEWVTNGYYPPKEGAELYEITPQGREILRSVYKEGKWQTYESEYYPLPENQTRSIDGPAKVYVGAFAQYAGYTFMVRGEIDGQFHLATYTAYPIEGLHVIEKGVYGIEVPKVEVILL